MRKKICWLAALGLVVFCFPGLSAQSLPTMTLYGATGLFSIPSGQAAWNTVLLGLDTGISYDFVDRNPIAKVGFGLFKWVEVNVVFDFQPRTAYYETEKQNKGVNNTDILAGLKMQIPIKGSTSVAAGGNLRFINYGQEKTDLAGQLYVAATYTGEFFTMPAETSMVLGYTFLENPTSNIDYGMGFDLLLLPDVFQRYVHWIIDFSNFSYRSSSLGDNAYRRGALNTGVRLDLAAIPALEKFKFAIDIIAKDIFDSVDRSFVVAAAFGLPIIP
jgi:hypothetical protein